MKIIHYAVAVSGLAAALVLSAFAASPAQAQVLHPHRQIHRATTLDRKAVRAASNGNYRKASRLRRQASHLRRAAHHGF